jgi:hypothetical protein
MRTVPLLMVSVALLSSCNSAGPAADSTPSPSPSASQTATQSPSPSPSPTTPPPTYLAVLGDWGAGTTAQRAVANRMCAVRTVTTFKIVVTTGDNFYPSGSASGTNWNTPMKCLIAAGVQWRAVWGNHDIVSGNSTGTVLGAHKWYTWSAGGAYFIALDAYRPANSTKIAFLRVHLAAWKARV